MSFLIPQLKKLVLAFTEYLTSNGSPLLTSRGGLSIHSIEKPETPTKKKRLCIYIIILLSVYGIDLYTNLGGGEGGGYILLLPAASI